MTETEDNNIKKAEAEETPLPEISLPEIPEGFIRLTHFTTEKVAKKIVENKEPFSYKKSLTINITSDAFSNNDQVKEVIRTGRNGPFERDPFGNAVIIIDLDMEEHKERCKPGYYEDNTIPNHNVLGYFVTDDLKNLHKNLEYEPSKNELTPNPRKGRINVGSDETDGQKGLHVRASENDDVW